MSQRLDFLGADRKAAVDRLVMLFDLVAADGGVHVVVLEGPQGRGKTRVVQAFYERLAARQSAPAYWPASLVEGDRHDPLHVRKRIYPESVAVPAGARLDWMWWGLSCERRGTGRAGQVLADDLTQLEQHHTGLIEAKGLDEQAQRSAREAFTALASFALSVLAPSVGDLASAATAVKESWEARRDIDRHRRVAESSGERLVDAADLGRLPLVRHIVELLSLVGAGGLPFVIVVDDAHDADPSLLALLDAITASRCPVPALVICTAWPDRLAIQESAESPSGFGSWLRELAAARPRLLTRMPLAPLDERALGDMVLRHAPATSPAVVRAFARRADGNPLVLEGLLNVPRVRRMIHDGRIEVTPAGVLDMPNSYGHLLLERWHELPDPVKEALCLASLQGLEFSEQLVVAASREVPTATDQLQAALGRAIDPHAWIRRVAESLRFHERVAAELASGERTGFFSDADVVRCRAAMSTHIDAWKRDAGVWEALDRDLRRLLLRIHVSLCRAGAVVDAKSAADSAYRLAGVARDLDADAALELVDLGLTWLCDAEEDSTNDTRLARARLLALKAGVHFYRGRILRYADGYEPPVAERERNRALGIATQTAVVAEFTELLGRDHPQTLAARDTQLWNLSLAASEVAQDALDLADDHARVFGPDHPSTVMLRSTLPRALRALGWPEAANVVETEPYFHRRGPLRCAICGEGDASEKTFSWEVVHRRCVPHPEKAEVLDIRASNSVCWRCGDPIDAGEECTMEAVHLACAPEDDPAKQAL